MSRGRQLSREIHAHLSLRPALLRTPRGGAALTWHWIGSEGDPWPAWLRAYKGQCGVYAIREGGKVVYVGSSKKQLYDTITRHFQTWKRTKNWWKGRYGAQHDPGMTYRRGRCQIAVQTVACGEHLEMEAKWIAKMSPRDNITEHPDGGEDAPF